ncbi:UDP-3-O-(3-hydroxymyristoyl)glucosamine N-acyltransferase [Sulfurospirillum oryzae]|uniref:UDP-3-O-(3-hydroxymyristoyl)glucosamine N-acyltransferase n=1 Tax=Sulfurospirillum oryzae TaxID=2976535 RepID=UPI0021E92B72|nr:UDP-3-O-(3-hydroxymyristoyl)glucosamine N-acyltransferase [Sulfurospirillum oryzae]
MKLSLLAQAISLEFSGSDMEVTSFATLKEATSSQIAFFENPKLLADLENTKAGVVILAPTYKEHLPKSSQALLSDNPHLSMAYASAYFAKKAFDTSKPATISDKSSIAPHVVIGSGTVIEEGTYIMPNVTIGANVRIGKNVHIFPNVVIYDDAIIKDNCIIQAGAIIGSDGFGYAHTKMGEHIKIHHSGNVILEEDVEVGSNTTIDRAVFGSTIIKKGTKIDNLVQIGHNCEIGQACILVAQTGISGSTKLGRNVVMGGQSATAGHLEIGDFATVAARGGVSKSIQGGKIYGGFPLTLQTEWLKTQAKLARFFTKN